MSVIKPRIFNHGSIHGREFSDTEIFQHSGKVIPLFMTSHKNCLPADYLLGPGPRLIKKNLPGSGLTKVEKHCSTVTHVFTEAVITAVGMIV
jgi:hypothetical protein